jgi:oligoendopeptidase F
LADRVLNGGSTELEAYLGFLQAGGRQFPIETLRAAGVDMLSPLPIEKTMDLFQTRIRQLRELVPHFA